MKKNALAVIPARGGSKRLPKKNILELSGKPLIAHSIEAALASNCFQKILVSTDSSEISAIANNYAGIEIDNRDPILAGDKTKVVDVIEEICNREETIIEFNIIAMLLPTAPFRRIKDIQKGMSLLSEEIDSVVSFTPYEFSPLMAVTLDDNDSIMSPVYTPSPLITGNTRSQDQVTSYRPNGSFFLSWISSFLKLKSFYRGRVKGVVMTQFGSTDIDEKEDLQLANFLVHSGLAESDFV